MKTKTKTKHWASITAGILSLAGYASAASGEKYTYDASGNIVEKSIDGKVTRFEYQNNYLKSNDHGITYEQDGAGRLISESKNGRTVRKLSYQFGDKVTGVDKMGSTTELFYNAEGQLVGKNSAGQTEAYAWDGLGLVMRGEQAYVNEKHLVGDVPALSNDVVTVSDPIGNTLSTGGKSFHSTAFGEGLEEVFLTGKPFVADLDSFVFKHRNYIADQGRWTTTDPLGFPDGQNSYSYVLGDPIGNYDKLGLTTEYLRREFSYQAQKYDNQPGTGTASNIGTPITLKYLFKVDYSCSNTVTEVAGAEGWDGAPSSGSVPGVTGYTWAKTGKPIVTSVVSGEKKSVANKTNTYIYDDIQWTCQADTTTTNTANSWTWTWTPINLVNDGKTSEFICEN